MKKLMLTVAIVCAAAMAQAYSISWKSGTMKSATGANATASNVSVMLINLTGDQYDGLVSKFQGSDYATGNAISKYLYDTYKGSTADYSKTTALQGNLTTKQVTAEGGSTAVSFDAGESAYKVIIYTSMDGDNNLNYIANIATATIDGDSPKDLSPSGFGLKYFADDTKTLSWQAAAVPEPTSGLLLLLGMAGLALRRRRA